MSQTDERQQPAASGIPERAWPRVVALVLVLAAVVVVSLFTGSFPAVAFVLALVASVMLHETGHFLTAKWSGMKVTEYFFGFGPRLWSVRRGETEYGIKAIPAGGYVKIVGMSNLETGIDPEDEPRTYRAQSYPRRLLVGIAGILMHFVICFVILMVLWTAVGVPGRPTLQVDTISKLDNGASPAQAAGFKVGDVIESVDGQRVARWEDLPPYIQARPGKTITFVVNRQGQPVTLTAVPADVNPEGDHVGFIGIGSKLEVKTVNPVVAVGRSAQDIGRLTVGSVAALGSFFSPSSLKSYGNQLGGNASKGNDQSRPVSVVGVVRIAGEAAHQGLFDFFGLLVMLNIFVAVFNLVPLLPLDGGHIAIATYERIRSRHGTRYHADVQKLLPLTAAVVAVLILLGVTSVWLDIVRPIANPFQ